MYFVYVLGNPVAKKHYTGFTADLVQRLGQHNSGVTKSTKNRGKWVLLYSEEFATRPEAMRRERFLKSGKGREELRRILRANSDVHRSGFGEFEGVIQFSHCTSSLLASAPVAQLDRASGYEPEGPVFESPRAHHSRNLPLGRVRLRRKPEGPVFESPRAHHFSPAPRDQLPALILNFSSDLSAIACGTAKYYAFPHLVE
jgi:putative endonuclease